MQRTQSDTRVRKAPGSVGQGGKEPRPRQPLSLTDLGLRLAGLAFIDGIAIWFALTLNNNNNLPAAIILLLITALVNYIFLADKLYPIRWLTPGLVMLILMVVYPLGYNVYISFTNYSSGHTLSREQVVTQLKQQTFQPKNGVNYTWTAYRNGAGQYKIVLINKEQNKSFLGDANGLKPYTAPDPLPNEIDGYTKLTPFQAAAAGEQLAKLNLKNENTAISITSSTAAQE